MKCVCDNSISVLRIASFVSYLDRLWDASFTLVVLARTVVATKDGAINLKKI